MDAAPVIPPGFAVESTPTQPAAAAIPPGYEVESTPDTAPGPGLRPNTPSVLDQIRQRIFGGPQGETTLGRAFPSMSGARIGDQPTATLPVVRLEGAEPGPNATPGQILAHSANQALSGLLTPKNLLIMAATGGLGAVGEVAPLLGQAINTGLSAYFAGQSLSGATDAARAAYAAHQKGDDNEALRQLGMGGVQAILGTLAGLHARTSFKGLNSEISEAIERHNDTAAAQVLAEGAQHYNEQPPPEPAGLQPAGPPQGKQPVVSRPVAPPPVPEPPVPEPPAPAAPAPETPAIPKGFEVESTPAPTPAAAREAPPIPAGFAVESTPARSNLEQSSEPGAPTRTPLHEMSPDELDQLIRQRTTEENSLLADLFGERGAERYNRLQRTANGHDVDRADAASAELGRMEATLSPEQTNRLFGIDQPEEHSLDEAKAMRQALGRIGGDTPEELGDSLKWALSRFDPEKPEANPTAYAQLRYGARLAQEQGWDTAAVSKAAAKGAASRFADPADAAFILSKFAKQQQPRPQSIASLPAEAMPAARNPEPTIEGNVGRPPAEPDRGALGKQLPGPGGPAETSGTPGNESGVGRVTRVETTGAGPSGGSELPGGESPGDGRLAPAAATDELTAAPTAPPRGISELPTENIHADPVRFQFKADTGGKAGVGEELKNIRVFDPDLAGVISVWHDPADGKTYVVNGHHRLELAKRTGAPTVWARYVNAANAQEAYRVGALINIGEGRGTPIDAAKVFRDSGLTPETLEKRGVSMRGSMTRSGMALANLSPAIFDRVVRGDLPVERAAVLGEALPNHQEQAAALALLDKAETRGKRPTNSEVRELIDFVKNGPVEHVTENQTNLFGEEEVRQNAAFEKAEISDYIRRRLGEERRVFSSASTPRAAEQLGSVGNVIKTEANARVAQEAAQAQEVYDKLKTSAGPVNDVLDASARQLAQGAPAAQLKNDAYERIRQVLTETIGGSGRADSGRGGGSDQGRPANAGLPEGQTPEGSAGTGRASGEDLGPEPVRAESSRAPELSGNRDEHYPRNAPDIYHARQARFEAIPLDEGDAANALAYVANRSGIEYLHRNTRLVNDDTVIGGEHVEPAQLAALLKNLKADEKSFGRAAPAAVRELQRIVEQAEQAGKSLIVIKDGADTSAEERALSLQEELDHALQRARTGRPLREHLGSAAAGFLGSPLGARAKTSLERRYGYDFASAGEAAAEIGVRLLAENRYRELGLSLSEARTLAAEYVQSLKEEYGYADTKPIARRIFDALRPGARTGATLGGPGSGEGENDHPDRGNTGAEVLRESGDGEGVESENARRPPPDNEREPSLFDAGENDEVASDAARDRDQLEGERLTAQLNAPLTRDEQRKKLRRSKENPQGGLFDTNEKPPQGDLFGSGLGAMQPYFEKFTKADVIPTAKELAQLIRHAGDDLKKLFAPASRVGAETAALSTRYRAAERQRAADIAQATLAVAKRYFDAHSQAENYEFIDRMEAGEKQAEPLLQHFADLIRSLLDERREAVRQLGTGKLQSFIENYFPHIWKDVQKAAELYQDYGKRPLEGSKSFLKKRSIDSFMIGIDAGLEPLSDNPVELVIAKLLQMDKYLAAHRILKDLKEAKQLRFVDAREGQAPPGWQKIDDPVATVYGPSIQHIAEYPNRGLWGGLDKVIDALDLKHKRGFDNLRGAIGRARQGTGEIKTMHGTAEDVLAHEIGHQIDWLAGSGKRFVTEYPDAQTVARLKRAYHTIKSKSSSLEDRREARKELKTLQAAIQQRKKFKAELMALADLREGRKEYTHKREEKMAQLAEMWVGARELFKRTAPMVFAEWEKFLDDNPKLHALRDIEGDTEVEPISQPYDVGGLVIKGHWWAPEPAARVLNHYLSPGLREKYALFRAYMGAANLMNQAQLGFSAFHLGFTTIDVATSKLALGIYQLAHGDVKKGLSSIAQTPIAPIANILRGDKMLKEWMAPGTQGERIGALIEATVRAGGRAQMDEFYQTHLVKRMMEAWRAGNILGALLRLPGAALEASAWPIMQYVVPRQKLGVFADMAQYELERLGADASDPVVQAALANAWDSTDNRLGQLVYDNLFWHKTVKDLSMATVRSVGWNVGTIRELAGAGLDTAKLLKAPPEAIRMRLKNGEWSAPKGADFTLKMGYAIAAPLVIGLIGATMYYLWHGHGPRHLKDYFFPTDAHGHRWSLPSYIKDLYEYAHDPVRTLAGKVHPFIQVVGEMLQNRDFYNKPIMHRHDPLVKKAEELATFVAKQYTPLAYRAKPHHHPSAEERALGFVGVRPAPKSLDQANQ
jgi:hypothetical protein